MLKIRAEAFIVGLFNGSKDSGFFFTYKQKAIIIKDTLCPFKTLQK